MGIGFKMVLMGKRFRSDDLNQALLLPPSLHDWLPEKHLARFLVDVVLTLEKLRFLMTANTLVRSMPRTMPRMAAAKRRMRQR